MPGASINVIRRQERQDPQRHHVPIVELMPQLPRIIPGVQFSYNIQILGLLDELPEALLLTLGCVYANV